MDKKNTLLGILFLGAGITFMALQQSKVADEQRRQVAEERALPAETAPAETGSPAQLEAPAAGAGADELVDLLATRAEATQMPDRTATAAEEVTFVLENEFIEVELTNLGGAVKEVRFKQTKRGGPDDYVFNESGIRAALSLSLSTPGGALREFALPYEAVESSAQRVVFKLQVADGLVIERAYSLADSEQDPYVINHATRFVNGSPDAWNLQPVYFNLGTSTPTSSDKMGMYLNVGYFDGKKSKFIGIRKFTDSSGFLGIGARRGVDEWPVKGLPMQWTSVKNQFFAAVLTPQNEIVSRDLTIFPVDVNGDGTRGKGELGITGAVGYEVGSIEPAEVTPLEFEFYVGPKEYVRLQSLGAEQDRVMQFGFFGGISKLLLLFMHAIHSVVPSWGWSIVIMTVIIKTLFWPLTAKASQSQKRMASIQEPMAALKEKYKDNPQRMQQETLKLFREHKINPAAGCLPILIQMPIFFGLFYMLRTASELRYAPFLWVQDLSQPDTVALIGGFPLNILPLFMGVSMFFQMRMTPMSPSADPLQQKLFKLLPFVFLIFLYNFSSGLVLYWTVQNLLTILQQAITNRRTDDPVSATAAAAPKPGAAAGAGKAKKSGHGAKVKKRKR